MTGPEDFAEYLNELQLTGIAGADWGKLIDDCRREHRSVSPRDVLKLLAARAPKTAASSL